MSSPAMALPPGATLVDDPNKIKLPPGASMVLGPKNPDPNYTPPPPHMDEEAMGDIGRFGLKMLPAVGATAAVAAGPPGWLAGAGMAALGGAGGSLVRQGAESAFDTPDAPHSLSDVAKNTATDAAEQGGYELGGRILTKALSKIFGAYVDPARLYQSGLKPTGQPAKAARTVATGLREQIPLGPGAASTARGRIGGLNTQIENMISSAPADIPAQDYVKNIQGRFDALRNQWSKDATLGTQATKQIDEMERQFLLQHGNPQPITQPSPTPGVPPTVIKPEDMNVAQLRQQARPLPAADAQAIKKQTYRSIQRANQGAWEPGANPGVAVDANQEITLALRQELVQLYPQIGGLNAREGALIDLEKALKGYAKREANRQISPYFIFPGAGALLGHMAGGAEGATAGAGIGAIAGHFLREAIEDPIVKSKLAIALSKAGGTAVGKAASAVAPYVAPTGIRTAGAAIETKNKNFPASLLKDFASRNGITEDEARDRLTGEGWNVQ